MSKKIHIFKSGTRQDSSGAMVTITDVDLAATAAVYDPARHEAPLVIGHPKHDSPAYGWVKSIFFSDGDLYVTPTQINPAFAEGVDAGQWKKVSASFYLPSSPSNPVPGTYYLRHVGFLGAQPPAVKGLLPVEFADTDGEQIVTLDFADYDDMQQAGLWRNLREWLLTKFGKEAADQVIPSYTVDGLMQSAMREEPPDELPPVNYAEKTVKPEQEAALVAENQQLKQQLAQAKQAELAAKAVARAKEHSDFADGLVAEGRLLPKHKPVVLAFLSFSEADTSLEFGEGDAKQSLGSAFRDYLKDHPVVIEFGEYATKGKAHGDIGTADFSAPIGYVIDQSRNAVHAQALAYQKANGVTYEQAVKAVEK
ncbi:MAG: hypothetical protein RI964_815 [Pseudomonadota bacterium]|jgi:hypothetical protein